MQVRKNEINNVYLSMYELLLTTAGKVIARMYQEA